MGILGKKELLLKVKSIKFHSFESQALAFVSTALICVSFAFPEWVSFPSGETAGVFQNCLSTIESSADGRYAFTFSITTNLLLFQVRKIVRMTLFQSPSLSQNVL